MNEEHLQVMRQGIGEWNYWREDTGIVPDLVGAKLVGAKLIGANLILADLIKANLTWADLNRAKLIGANLIRADLSWADLSGADLNRADLSGARLIEAKLVGANLAGANLAGANLTGANLIGVQLVNTKVWGALFTNCRVYGISVWGLEGVFGDQSNLIITKDSEPIVTVDNLEVAQFIYLLLHSSKLRDVIDTVSKKAVLILGRFSDTQKPVLEAIRDQVKKCGYLPILFDWDKSDSRDLVETVSTLAHLSKFVIADITEAKSIPAELMCIVPNLPSLAVQPLMRRSDYEYALFDHIKRYPWVLDVHLYDSKETLIANFKEVVLDPVERFSVL